MKTWCEDVSYRFTLQKGFGAPAANTRDQYDVGMLGWRCRVCGHIHFGDGPPERCPVCGADAGKFVSNDSKADAHPPFTYRNNELWIEETPVRQLVLAHSTPLVAYSAGRLRSNARECTRHKGIEAMFSVKACYLPGVIRIVCGEGLGAEVNSEREFRLARESGVPASRILWTSVALTNDDVRIAVHEKVGYLSINNETDLRAVSAEACKTSAVVRVLVRIHPANTEGDYICRGSRLGIDVQDGEALRLLRIARSLPGIDLDGIQFHAQIRQTDPKRHENTLRSSMQFLEEVEKEVGCRLRTISVGGGLAGRSEMLDVGLDGNEYLATLADVASKGTWPINLLCEPGRFIVDDAAIAIARILTEYGRAGCDWLIVDIGSNYLVTFSEREFDAVPVIERICERTRVVSIGDQLSTYTGVLLRNRSMPVDVPEGLLAFKAVGAYTFSVAQRFIQGIPEVVLVDGHQAELLWKRDLASDWVAGLLRAGVSNGC